MVRYVVLIVALLLILLFGRDAVARLPQFPYWVQSLGAWGPLVFVLSYGVAAVLLIPCFPLTLAAGALWGFTLGLIYVLAGATFGAVLAFYSARYLVRHRVERYVARYPRLEAIDRAVESEGMRLVCLLRLSPVVPFTLLNYVLGVSRLRFRDYLGGMTGIIPVAAMYVYAGKVAGDLASLATGAAPRGTMYYTMMAIGLGATLLASLLIVRAANRAVTTRTESAIVKTP